MTHATAYRHVRVTAAEVAELRVPVEVAEMLGAEAQLEVGPGQVVTLRPGRLRTAVVARGVKPLDDPATLCHSRGPLNPRERAALAEFLDE